MSNSLSFEDTPIDGYMQIFFDLSFYFPDDKLIYFCFYIKSERGSFTNPYRHVCKTNSTYNT